VALAAPAAPGGGGGVSGSSRRQRGSDSLEETGSNICCLPAFFGQISGRWAQDAVGPRIDSSPSSLFFCFIIAGRGSWA
jgi:hypothetical protein